jgi:predicted amidohydrolase
MKIALFQSDIIWENPEANFAHVEPQIRAAAAAGARLIVLPEMFACGFSMNTSAIAEPSTGPTPSFLRRCAREHGLWVGASFPLADAKSSRPTNHFLLAGPDGSEYGYDKIHPFSFAKEDEHYRAGTTFAHVEIEGIRFTLFVCYDLRFADEFWATADETDAYLLVANWPDKRREHWRTLLRARAIENQAYMVAVNRVGEANGLSYSGDSVVLDPWGAALCEANKDEILLLADVDLARVSHARAKFPIRKDRR